MGDILTVEPITGRSELPVGWAATFGEGSQPARNSNWPEGSEVRGLLEMQLARIQTLFADGASSIVSAPQNARRFPVGRCWPALSTDGTTKLDTRAKCICWPSFIDTGARNVACQSVRIYFPNYALSNWRNAPRSTQRTGRTRSTPAQVPQAANRVVGGWGVVAVLLLVLNVWSCWWWDRCYLQGKRLGVQINSDAGHVVIVVWPKEPSVTEVITGHLPSSGPADPFYDNDVLGFYFKRTPNGLRLDIPYWFIVLLSYDNRGCALATLVAQTLLPPHSANRHDARCRGAGADRVAAVIS